MKRELTEREKKAKANCRAIGLHASPEHGFPVNLKLRPLDFRETPGGKVFHVDWGWGLRLHGVIHIGWTFDGRPEPFDNYWEALTCGSR
jgi:hypothetical protein